MILNIEKCCTDNPKEFWNHIKKLGPAKKKNIPMEAYENNEENGQILYDTMTTKYMEDRISEFIYYG